MERNSTKMIFKLLFLIKFTIVLLKLSKTVFYINKYNYLNLIDILRIDYITSIFLKKCGRRPPPPNWLETWRRRHPRNGRRLLPLLLLFRHYALSFCLVLPIMFVESIFQSKFWIKIDIVNLFRFVITYLPRFVSCLWATFPAVVRYKYVPFLSKKIVK